MEERVFYLDYKSNFHSLDEVTRPTASGPKKLVRVTRIELASFEWESNILPLNYTREKPDEIVLKTEALCQVISSVSGGDFSKKSK